MTGRRGFPIATVIAAGATALAALFTFTPAQAQFGPNHNRPTIEPANGHEWLRKNLVAKLAIECVLPSQTGEQLSVTIKFHVDGHDLGIPTQRDACHPGTRGPGGGQYIEIIVGGNRNISDTRITTVDQVKVPIKPGLDTIRAYLCYDDGECVKSEVAFVAIVYNPEDNTFRKLDAEKILTFNLPRQNDRLRLTVVDYVAFGFVVADNKIRVSVRNMADVDATYRQAGVIDSWNPYDLDLMEVSTSYYIIRLEILDSNGNPINGELTSVDRIVCVSRE